MSAPPVGGECRTCGAVIPRWSHDSCNECGAAKRARSKETRAAHHKQWRTSGYVFVPRAITAERAAQLCAEWRAA